MAVQLLFKKYFSMGWKDISVVRDTSSSRGNRFNSQLPHVASKSSVTLVPEDPTQFLAPTGTGTETYVQVKCLCT